MNAALPEKADASEARLNLQRLLPLGSPERRRWLTTLSADEAADRLRQMADEVTATTRVDLAEAEALSRVIAWLVPRVADPSARARAWRAMGHVSALKGRYQTALERYQRALDGFAGARQPVEGAVTRSGALQTLIYLGRYRQAFAWASQARRVLRARGDRLRLARLDTNVANILHRHDRFDEALARYRGALDAFAEGDHVRDEAIVLRNMAVCYIGLNRLGPALETYARARDRASSLGLSGLVAAVDYNVAYLHYLRGDYHRAIELYDAARLRCEAAHDPYHAALCDLDHAELALELNLVQEGSALAASAGDRFRALGLVYERAKALVNQGVAAQREGQWTVAAAYYRRARALFAQEGNGAWTALMDLYLAFVLVERGKPAEGAELGRAALRRVARMPFHDRTALAHYVLARANASLSRTAVARRHCRRALERLEVHPVPALAYRVWHLLGRIEVKAGRDSEAVRAFEQAHLHVEALRGHLGTDSLRIAFLVDKLAVYESLVRVTLGGRSPKLARAFRIMEQAKARTLVEQITLERGATAAATDRPSVDLGTLAASYRKRDALLHPTTPRERTEVGRLERDIRQLEHQAQRRGPGDVTSGPNALVTLETLQASLAPTSVLVEYYVADGRLLGWVIGQRHVSVQDLGPVRAATRALRFFQFQVAQCRWRRQVPSAPAVEHLRALYDILVRPLARHIDAAAHVVVVPHGPLHAVPFGALYDGDSFLHDRATVSVAPSAAVYRQTLQPVSLRAPRALVLGVSDEDAPFIAAEVRQVASLFQAPTVVAGADATRNAFTREAAQASVLHLATHGHFRSDNPEYSSIQLADSPVTLRDLELLRLDAALVTLSGCGTGRNVVAAGDELFGLSRGLLRAGARSLLVSLWDVHDSSTARFMFAFYRGLRDGQSRAEATQAAAATVRRTHPHPYFWAPFVLVGDHGPLRVPPIFWRADANPSSALA